MNTSSFQIREDMADAFRERLKVIMQCIKLAREEYGHESHLVAFFHPSDFGTRPTQAMIFGHGDRIVFVLHPFAERGYLKVVSNDEIVGPNYGDNMIAVRNGNRIVTPATGF